ncbi:LytTR family DNA-binding domain-containing protein [Rhodoferax sp.]|uniref:LytR/AlgR family response regulator transcription factor n=1 Tax=Rhodoferax sp. TaxID=50421 RepID=UPI0026065717|nr:LytTR family DNA-binding domain-containing protein [Rhodoferax sp.]MDD2920011.1 LytTR family DNA-binding domain-containing protein [Rhodoferax sp.]
MITGQVDLPPVRALIADDERLLREQLQARLVECWPELQVCGIARDGLEAVRLTSELNPDVVFLDIRMPGLTGIEAAREIAAQVHWRGEIVFVTAYDEYAVTAFEEGAVDYLLKPVERARLDVTVARLRARLAQVNPPDHQGALLQTLTQLQARLNGNATPRLRWLQCGVGSSTRLVNVEDVLFFRSDEKYTRVQLQHQEAFVRTPIRELIVQLDPQQFWQIHRSTVVNLGAVAAVQRDDSGRQRVTLKQHPEVLEVSRGFNHLFRGT